MNRSRKKNVRGQRAHAKKQKPKEKEKNVHVVRTFARVSPWTDSPRSPSPPPDVDTVGTSSARAHTCYRSLAQVLKDQHFFRVSSRLFSPKSHTVLLRCARVCVVNRYHHHTIRLTSRHICFRLIFAAGCQGAPHGAPTRCP